MHPYLKDYIWRKEILLGKIFWHLSQPSLRTPSVFISSEESGGLTKQKRALPSAFKKDERVYLLSDSYLSLYISLLCISLRRNFIFLLLEMCFHYNQATLSMCSQRNIPKSHM